MNTTVQVPLSLFEALHLDDKLTLFAMHYSFAGDLELEEDDLSTMRGIMSDARAAASDILILKLSSVIIELQNDQSREVVISLTKKELWTLRECISTADRIGEVKVGISLKIKLHKALLDLYGQDEVEGLPEAVEPAVDFAKLQEWRNNNASGTN